MDEKQKKLKENERTLKKTTTLWHVRIGESRRSRHAWTNMPETTSVGN